MLTLYSKPGCRPCVQTKHALHAQGTEFIERDVTTDPEALAYVKDVLGYAGVPVVVVNETDHWVGFDATRLASLT